MTVSVVLRGSIVDVEVDRFDIDEPTNAFECEWHFDGMTPEEHDDLHLNDDEEDGVVEQISRAMHEREWERE